MSAWNYHNVVTYIHVCLPTVPQPHMLCICGSFLTVTYLCLTVEVAPSSILRTKVPFPMGLNETDILHWYTFSKTVAHTFLVAITCWGEHFSQIKLNQTPQKKKKGMSTCNAVQQEQDFHSREQGFISLSAAERWWHRKYIRKSISTNLFFSLRKDFLMKRRKKRVKAL